MPLMQRAAAADGELRRRLIAVVEATLARDAEDLSVPSEIEDERCLLGLASVLHRWPSNGGESAH